MSTIVNFIDVRRRPRDLSAYLRTRRTVFGGDQGGQRGLTVGRRSVGRWVVGKSKPTKDEWVWPRGGSPADWGRHSNAATQERSCAHPCKIHTRPLLPSFSTDSFFLPCSPISFSGQDQLVSCRSPVYPPIRTKR